MGGLAGGFVALAARWAPYAFPAFGLMLTGFGIAFASTRAIQVISRNSIRLESTIPQAEMYFRGKEAVWELLRGDSFLFGNGPTPRGVRQYVFIPDDAMADRHAWLRASGADFRVFPDPENQDGLGNPVQTLSVERAGQIDEPSGQAGGITLQDGDILQMGNTRFRFSTHASIIVVLLVLCTCARAQQPAVGHLRLVPTDKGRLCECGPGSQKPALRIAMNVRDQKGLPARVPVLDPRAVHVYEGSQPLTVIPAASAKVERYAVLLIDVSGSMLENTSDGQRKFDAAISACKAFASDFAEGIDHVAVAPFGSHNVTSGVEHAVFHSRRQQLEDAISAIPQPLRTSNTGLYTAIQAAVDRLAALKQEAANLPDTDRRLLIVVLTDGRNEFQPGRDDPGLLASKEPVKDEIDRAGVPVITVGLGDQSNLDEAVLRFLAFPLPSNYLRASNSSGLGACFPPALARSRLIKLG